VAVEAAKLAVRVSAEGGQQTASDLRQMGTAVTKAGESAKTAAGNVQSFDRAGGGLSGTLKSIVTSAAGFATGQLAVAGLGKAFGAVKDSIFGFNSSMQQSQIAFTTLLGSSAAAREHLAELTNFAKRTPFEQGPLIQMSQRLQAMGFDAKSVVPTLTAVGDAVAGLGGNAQTMDRVVTAMGQMNAKGKASAEEMMQLTEAGIPAWDMLAKKIGTDVPTAMKRVSDGAVSSATAIDALTTGMGERFGGMMEKQSKTLAGSMSTIRPRQYLVDLCGPLSLSIRMLALPVVGGSDGACTRAVRRLRHAPPPPRAHPADRRLAAARTAGGYRRPALLRSHPPRPALRGARSRPGEHYPDPGPFPLPVCRPL
jgi:tape measure domain-containing protein